MDLHGTLAVNLKNALASAVRLRGQPVHKDTLTFWRGLVAYARDRASGASPAVAAELEPLITALELELAERG
jgi:hypothetical protein